ncbi:hypothetical protein PSI23_08380 [Xenorhabdus sp. XENO-10]|uniref:Uncharacterized protein n=1 Tax=Xenorhabdus yunnanensis TaxID=3025878 RepID=A0ABT5LE04_9GAMM|nr:hypothetical protein [Xenorhabdus yunnanensis]MDC9589337.1 hypothetical protein [Xenorhabdus yunnanensis]
MKNKIKLDPKILRKVIKKNTFSIIILLSITALLIGFSVFVVFSIADNSKQSIGLIPFGIILLFLTMAFLVIVIIPGTYNSITFEYNRHLTHKYGLHFDAKITDVRLSADEEEDIPKNWVEAAELFSEISINFEFTSNNQHHAGEDMAANFAHFDTLSVRCKLFQSVISPEKKNML